MRVFKIPNENKREEKIFGGYLSLRQDLYLMLTASTFTIFILPLSIVIKLSIITILCAFLLLCAFMKINEQNFDKFFFYAVKYIFRKKNFVYERCLKW